MSEKIRDQLIADGYDAHVLNVWSPHSMVNCTDCREDGEVWFDSDGSAILGRDKDKYKAWEDYAK